MYDSKVYTEVYEIINIFPSKERKKIPVKWYQLIESKRDKDYEFDARDENVILLPDTEKILSVIYTDYLASEEERKIIKAKEESFVKKNYNKEIQNEDVELKIETSKIMIKSEERFLDKLFNRIKYFLKFKK
ncbi:MAG: hypothetical protein E7314_06480 [Clostridiales bacterium]|nr:hypothetical protein [Clostridiales bacterium]